MKISQEKQKLKVGKNCNILLKGIWDLLAESSSYCSMDKLACCHRSLEAHTGILHNIFGRRTCMASCATSLSIDNCTSACNLFSQGLRVSLTWLLKTSNEHPPLHVFTLLGLINLTTSQ